MENGDWLRLCAERCLGISVRCTNQLNLHSAWPLVGKRGKGEDGKKRRTSVLSNRGFHSAACDRYPKACREHIDLQVCTKMITAKEKTTYPDFRALRGFLFFLLTRAGTAKQSQKEEEDSARRRRGAEFCWPSFSQLLCASASLRAVLNGCEKSAQATSVVQALLGHVTDVFPFFHFPLFPLIVFAPEKRPVPIFELPPSPVLLNYQP